MSAPVQASTYEALKDDLGYLRLIRAAECFAPLVEQARAEGWEHLKLLAGVIGEEVTATRNRRLAARQGPDVAERRRSKAERERARVTVFREESGAVGLSGRDLPAAQALAGHANVVARAKLYEVSGAFPGQATSGLQALAHDARLGCLFRLPLGRRDPLGH